MRLHHRGLAAMHLVVIASDTVVVVQQLALRRRQSGLRRRVPDTSTNAIPALKTRQKSVNEPFDRLSQIENKCSWGT